MEIRQKRQAGRQAGQNRCRLVVVHTHISARAVRVLLYYLCSSILWPTSQHPRGIGYIGGRDGLPRRLTVCRSRMDVCLPLLIRWGCFSRQQFHEVVGVSRGGKDRHPGRERETETCTH